LKGASLISAEDKVKISNTNDAESIINKKKQKFEEVIAMWKKA
jgi:hypothetical protein